MTDTMRVFSLGYEGMSLDGYVDVLKANEVRVVVDVRETAWSYKPGFSKKPLAEGLHAEGIAYIHLKSAGNPAKNRKQGLDPDAVICLYKEHLDANPDCLDAIYELIVMTDGAVCLLCFEEKPHECHRKVLLDRISEISENVMTCHLSGHLTRSKKPVAAKRVPKTDDREGTRIHMKVPEDERSVVMA